MRSYYRHTQIGLLTLVGLGAGMLIVAVRPRERDLDALLRPVLVVLAVTAVVFASLTVEVTGEVLTLRFGPGLIRKRIRIADIQTCVVVRNPWWYGWGIRRTPHGWLYNVSGRGAVELTLTNGRRLRVGTDEPARLCQAIQQAIAGEAP